MNQVVVDPASRTAAVGAGAQWADVVGAAAPHGLAALHGSSGTVGVAGYTLGGGVSWLARSEGFTCNHVVSLEVVTADGEIRRISRDSEPELFWALRGGGGGQAIVTELEVELVEMETAYGGALMWPIEQASEIAQAWREWTETVPEELTSTIKLVRFPPFPELPDPIRGRALAVVTFVFRGDEAEGAELVAPLRAVADPYLDMVSTLPAPALAEIAGDPKDPVPGRGDGFLLKGLDADAIDAYVDLAGPDVDVPLIHLEIRHLGGAMDRPGDDHGALDVAAGSHLVYAIGAAMSPEMDGAIIGTLTAIKERMEPWRAELHPVRLRRGAARSQGLVRSGGRGSDRGGEGDLRPGRSVRRHRRLMWLQREIALQARPRGFHLVGEEVVRGLPELRELDVGLLNLHILHTSASLALNENASADVRADLESWFNDAVREDAPYWRHTFEGTDDMPAHVKSVLIGPSLTLPIRGGDLALGTWQGIYLCEHRDNGGSRRLIATLNGE